MPLEYSHRPKIHQNRLKSDFLRPSKQSSALGSQIGTLGRYDGVFGTYHSVLGSYVSVFHKLACICSFRTPAPMVCLPTPWVYTMEPLGCNIALLDHPIMAMVVIISFLEKEQKTKSNSDTRLRYQHRQTEGSKMTHILQPQGLENPIFD